MNKLKGFILALQFLTKFTIKRNITATPRELGKSGVWFPVVGLVLGLLLVALNLLLTPWLPEIIVSIILILCLIGFTGALHLDGFIDLVDGFYAGHNPAEVLKIMRDTNVGSMGVTALSGLLLLKIFSFNALDPVYKNVALMLMPVLGRWSLFYAACKYDYARQETGTGQIFIQENSLQQFIKASIFPVFFSVLLLKSAAIWLVLLAFFSMVGLSAWFNKRIGGMTGDSLGAVVEIMEAVVLLLLLLLLNR